jgi:prophage regulatory protein
MESEVEHLSQKSNAAGIDTGQSQPLPGTEAYEALPQFPKRSPLPYRRTIRRHELRQIVPLAETTIYEMERRGEFPRRFNLTPRCVVWDLAEVETWIEERKLASRSCFTNVTKGPASTLIKTDPFSLAKTDPSLESFFARAQP